MIEWGRIESGNLGVLDAPASLGMTTASVQLRLDLVNALGEQFVGDLALHRLLQDSGGLRERVLGRGGADVGQRLGFGQRDLALALVGAPNLEVYHASLGFGGDSLAVGF